MEIAELFRQVAAVYTLHNVEGFRTQAYISVASSIEQISTPLREIWQADKLEDIPGVGAKFHKYLDELFTTGNIKRLDKILQSEPAGMYPLLDVPGIGPKTAYKLAQTFKLKNADTVLQEVVELAKKGKIQQLEGFSEISEKKILQAVLQQQSQSQSPRRMLLVEAEQIAADVLDYVRHSSLVKQAEALGSLRRRVPTVGDVDIAVATNKPKEFVDYLLKFAHIRKVVSAGEKMVIFIHSSGHQVDVKTQTPEQWGSMLQHYTGSKLHNIHLRTDALSQGMSLSEYGIKKGKKELHFRDEKAFYKQLGMDFIPPELREDEGEIEAARKGTLPKLVDLKDIKGDFHIHTNIDNYPSSHDMGVSSVAELLAKAQQLGYAYIGLTDHNPKQSDLTPNGRLLAVKLRRATIEKAVADFTKTNGAKAKSNGTKNGQKVPQVFIGLEVDILSDGRLALEDEGMELLDYAIASIHSGFKGTREENTQRILKALAHPKVRILGHPTGRKLEERAEIECDWETVFKFASEQKKMVEINSSPERTDLPSLLIKQAIAAGVKLVIDSDSHAAESLDLMKYGIWNARRGWARVEDIANTVDSWKW